jgi:hypothetical protein
MRQQNKQRMTGGVCSVATEGKSAAITPGKVASVQIKREHKDLMSHDGCRGAQGRIGKRSWCLRPLLVFFPVHQAISERMSV